MIYSNTQGLEFCLGKGLIDFNVFSITTISHFQLLLRKSRQLYKSFVLEAKCKNF